MGAGTSSAPRLRGPDGDASSTSRSGGRRQPGDGQAVRVDGDRLVRRSIEREQHQLVEAALDRCYGAGRRSSEEDWMAVAITVPTSASRSPRRPSRAGSSRPATRSQAGEPLVELETDKASSRSRPGERASCRDPVTEGSDVEVGAVLGRIERGRGAAAPQPPASRASPRRRTSRSLTEGSGPPTAETAAASREPASGERRRRRARRPGRAQDRRPRTGSTSAEVPARARRATSPRATSWRPSRLAERASRPRPSSPRPVEPGRRPRRPAPSRPHRRRCRPARREERHDAAPQADRRAAGRGAAHRRDADDLQRGRHVARSWSCAPRTRTRSRRSTASSSASCRSSSRPRSRRSRRSRPSTAEIDGDDIVYKHYYDIGVAVSTEQGLVVPVVRDADQLELRRDREGDRRPRQARPATASSPSSDLQGGTFTITNGGVFGSLLTTPILNPPQSGILGMHAIQKRPVVRRTTRS